MLYEVITRTAQEHAGGGRTDAHLAAAIRTVDIGQYHPVAAHAAFAGFRFRRMQGLAELLVEAVQLVLPVQLALGDRNNFV